MGGAASKPGFPVSSEQLDGDFLEEEEEEEEEKYFSAQKVREKDDDDEGEEEEEEMTTIPETSSETQRAREEARGPGSTTAKKSSREAKGRSSVSSLPRLLFATTDDDDDETKRKAKRRRSPSEEEEETPPKQAASTVKMSKMIEVAKFSTTKSSEIAKRKKKTPDTPHLSVGLSVPASSKHRLELELKRLDAVAVATKLEFVCGPNYPTTRRSEQFKKHRLRSTSTRGKKGEHLPSSPATNMDWA